MLPSVDALKSKLLSLPESSSPIEAATNFINVVGDFMDQVQGGPTGNPGIFKYARPVAIPLIAALPPVPDMSWIIPFATAIHAGATAAILTPGTVASPAWTVSVMDIVSPPINIGLAAALPILIAGLAKVNSTDNPPLPLAQAIHDYAMAFIFLCTGLFLAGLVPAPLPLPFPAQ